MTNEIPKLNISTSCRDCVFAEYEEDMQVDCYLRRLEKFEAQGATVVGHNDGVKQYLTVNRFCNMARRPEFTEALPIAELAVKLRKEATVRIAAIIYLDRFTLKDDLARSLESLGAQSIPIVKVVILLDEDTGITPAGAINRLKKAELGCPWEVVKIEPWDDATKVSYLGSRYDHAVDIGVSKLDDNKVTYYTVAMAGFEWPKEFISRIDKAINEDLVPLSVMYPLECDFGLTVQTKLHNHPQVCGNIGGNILFKLERIAECGLVFMEYKDLPL